jgi:hypothetical protein
MSESDFIRAIEDAQRLPESLAEQSGQVPDLLSGMMANVLGSRNPLAGDLGKVPGGKSLNFEYKSARLTMGQVCTGFDHGAPIYEDKDESDRLKEIMDASLNGEAIIVRKTETFLKDGTVVVWVEWMTPKEHAPKKSDGSLSIAELLSPESSRFPENDSGDDENESDD